MMSIGCRGMPNPGADRRAEVDGAWRRWIVNPEGSMSLQSCPRFIRTRRIHRRAGSRRRPPDGTKRRPAPRLSAHRGRYKGPDPVRGGLPRSPGRRRGETRSRRRRCAPAILPSMIQRSNRTCAATSPSDARCRTPVISDGLRVEAGARSAKVMIHPGRPRKGSGTANDVTPGGSAAPRPASRHRARPGRHPSARPARPW